MLFEKAIAGQTHDGKVTTDNLTIPFDWLFGTTLTMSALFFSVVWWVRGLSAKVDANSKAIETMLSKCVLEHQKIDSFNRELQDDIRRQMRQDIAQSASDICHGFELFAVEIRSEVKTLHEKIDERNQTIAGLKAQTDRQGQELREMQAAQRYCGNFRKPTD